MCLDGRATRGDRLGPRFRGLGPARRRRLGSRFLRPRLALVGDRVEALEMTHRHYVERAAGPQAYLELLKQTFGPVVGIYATLAGEPERVAALDRDFLEFATRANSGPPQGPAEYRYEYLLVVVRRRAL